MFNSLKLYMTSMFCVVDAAAVTLGKSESLLQQLMESCKVEEHAGVKGTSNIIHLYIGVKGRSTDI